jgi:hypothetical protein
LASTYSRNSRKNHSFGLDAAKHLAGRGKILVRWRQRQSRLRCRRVLQTTLQSAGFRLAGQVLALVPDPDAVPPEPTPANLARPMLAKHKGKRKAN